MTIDAPYSCCWGWALVLGHRAVFRCRRGAWPLLGLIVGLGILAAARALELDFVPLFNEEYQLVVPREHYASALLAAVLDILRSRAFASDVDALGGYDVSRMGQIVYEQ